MILTPQDTDRIHRITLQFGILTPRELSLVIEGMKAGKDIMADKIQPTITALELARMDANIIPVT